MMIYGSSLHFSHFDLSLLLPVDLSDMNSQNTQMMTQFWRSVYVFMKVKHEHSHISLHEHTVSFSV